MSAWYSKIYKCTCTKILLNMICAYQTWIRLWRDNQHSNFFGLSHCFSWCYTKTRLHPKINAIENGKIFAHCTIMYFVLFGEINRLICQLAKKLDTVPERENNLPFKLSGFYFALSREVLLIMLNPKCLHDTNLWRYNIIHRKKWIHVLDLIDERKRFMRKYVYPTLVTGTRTFASGNTVAPPFSTSVNCKKINCFYTVC